MRTDLIEQMYDQESYYWWHVMKRAWVKILLHRFKKTEKKKILDIGCGTGKMLEELRSYGKIFGVDISPQALGFCKKRGITNVISGTFGEKQLAFEDHSFDVILCLDIIEHIENYSVAFSEIHRLLKPTGICIVTVPAYQFLFSYWDVMLHHKRRYTKKLLITQAQDSQLKPVYSSYFHSWVLPISILVRSIKRFSGNKQQSDFMDLPQIIHKVFILLSTVEMKLAQKTPIPLGLSVCAVFTPK